MTARLEDQIREVAVYADDVVEAVSVSEVLERAVSVQPLPVAPTSSGVRRGFLVAAAAFVIAILVAAPFFLSSSSDQPPATVPVEVTTSIVESTPTSVADPVPTPTDSPTAEAAAAGVGTYQALPDQSSIGWEWHQTGLPESGFGIWRLTNGTYIAFSQGWESYEYQEDRSVLLFEGGSGNAVVDPVERLLVSADGTSWNEISLERFNGFVTYAHHETSSESPYFYVSTVAAGAYSGERGDFVDFSSGSTWATEDGQTWFEVLVNGASSFAFSENGFVQIGDSAVASSAQLVSSDGGRSFTSVETDMPTDRLVAYEHEGMFRLLAWGDGQSNYGELNRLYAENPVLWESPNGAVWSQVGVVSGLDPRPDGGALSSAVGLGWSSPDERHYDDPTGLKRAPWVGSSANGSLLLVAKDDRDARVIGEGSLSVFESHDGGLTWQQPVGVPIDSDVATIVAAHSAVTTLDGWIVISTPEVTLATDGDNWIRVDVPNGDPNGVDESGNRLVPIGVRGTVTSGPGIASIALPTR